MCCGLGAIVIRMVWSWHSNKNYVCILTSIPQAVAYGDDITFDVCADVITFDCVCCGHTFGHRQSQLAQSKHCDIHYVCTYSTVRESRNVLASCLVSRSIILRHILSLLLYEDHIKFE